MSISDSHSMSMRARRKRDEAEYRWVFWCAYPFFLLAAIVSRLMPRRHETARPERPRQSVFKEAWVAANSSIPFAFMN